MGWFYCFNNNTSFLHTDLQRVHFQHSFSFGTGIKTFLYGIKQIFHLKYLYTRFILKYFRYLED